MFRITTKSIAGVVSRKFLRIIGLRLKKGDITCEDAPVTEK